MTPSFQQGLNWTAVSFVVQAVCGVLLHALIARYYGAEILGSFNQVFALYSVAAQLAVSGVHLAVGALIPAQKDSTETPVILLAAMIWATVGGIVALAAGWLMQPLLGWVFSSELVRAGWLWILPGVAFFALNKVLLAAINGLRWMRLYAFGLALRMVLMVGTLIIAHRIAWPGAQITLIISISEGLTACILSLILAPTWLLGFRQIKAVRLWIGRQLAFGIKGLPSGAIMQINSRIDVLMLGFLSSDTVVGVYSLASAVAEGMTQIGVVVRQNLNPILSRVQAEKSWDAYLPRLKAIRNRSYLLLGSMAVVAILIFPLYRNIMTGDQPGFDDAWLIFAIMMGGFAIRAGYIPFNMALLQAGYPTAQSIFILAIALINAIANLILIPFLGGIGAATASAIAFGLSVPLLRVMLARTAGVRL